MSSDSDCGNLTVVNGHFTAESGTTFGQTAKQSCYIGYTMSGVETVACTESGWNASAAVCTIVSACLSCCFIFDLYLWKQIHITIYI